MSLEEEGMDGESDEESSSEEEDSSDASEDDWEGDLEEDSFGESSSSSSSTDGSVSSGTGAASLREMQDLHMIMLNPAGFVREIAPAHEHASNSPAPQSSGDVVITCTSAIPLWVQVACHISHARNEWHQ